MSINKGIIKNHIMLRIRSLSMIVILLLCFLFDYANVYAAPKSGYAETQEELAENAAARKELRIESNEREGWPAGPEISAESAILIDVDTKTILYAKNIHEELYPASTTKLMTCLLAQEMGKMTDMVDFSYDAVHSVPRDGSNMGMDAGQSITLEQCLYGILVGSANEVANAVAEHISGSVDEFVNLMNKRAEELGCTNTHFNNANGLQEDNHYTSAYDLSLIACEYFSNEMLSRIANTSRYHFEPTDTQPDEFWLRNKHSLINGEIEYEGIKGGKTGFTDDARQTLVTCCEQNGMRLVCVVMMEEAPDQFYDTVTLFDYGYSNFTVENVADNEDRYTIDEESFFKTGSDIFGDSSPFLRLNPDSIIVKPNNVEWNNLDTRISYDVDGAIAQIFYSYSGIDLGSTLVETVENTRMQYEFEHVSGENSTGHSPEIAIEQDDNTIFINVKNVLLVVLAIAVVLIIIFTIIKISKEYHFAERKRGHGRRRRSGKKRWGKDRDLYL